MEIQVKVIQHLPEQSGTSRNGNQWRKQEFVGETLDQYPKKIVFSIFNGKCNMPNVGASITVGFDVESRSWAGRDGSEHWSTSIMAYAIKGDPQSEAPQPAVPDNSVYQVPQGPQTPPPPPANPDDLPF